MYLCPLLVIAQIDTASLSNAQMKRNKWNVEIAHHKCEKQQLKMMFTSEQFRAYNNVRNCYIASIPLLTIGACGVAIATGFTCAGIRAVSENGWHRDDFGHDPRLGFNLALFTFGATLIPLIPGIILITYGINQLNKLVTGYNQSHHLPGKTSLTIDAGLTNTGFGIMLNF